MGVLFSSLDANSELSSNRVWSGPPNAGFTDSQISSRLKLRFLLHGRTLLRTR